MSDKLLEKILNFVLNNMGNSEMMHLNHYVESRAEFWQQIQTLQEQLKEREERIKELEKVVKKLIFHHETRGNSEYYREVYIDAIKAMAPNKQGE